MNLEKYICDLLYKHECVIVPEFGGFITNYEPASIQSVTHTISPPRKFLVFNSSLSINDGLLATEISSKMQGSFDEAMQFIRREVTAWKKRLKAGKTITLTGIGSFRANKDGKLEFKPDQEQNFFNDAFGLTGLVIPPLQKQMRKPKSPPAYYHKPARKTSARAIRRLAWAAAITIPLISASYWSIMNYDTLRQYAMQHSGIVSFFKPDTKSTADKTTSFETEDFSHTDGIKSEIFEDRPAPVDLAQQEPLASGLPSKLDTSGDEMAETLPAAVKKPVSEPAATSIRAYHIIIGSFESEDNAKDLADELVSSGWNAKMFSSAQGMHRISIASYIDKQEALQQLFKIRKERNSNAWLLRI